MFPDEVIFINDKDMAVRTRVYNASLNMTSLTSIITFLCQQLCAKIGGKKLKTLGFTNIQINNSTCQEAKT